MIIAGFGVSWSFRASSDPHPLPNNAAIIKVGLDQRVLCYLKVFVSNDNLSRKRNHKRAVVIFLKVPVFVTFTANGKRQFIPRHHAFPLIAV